MSFQPPQPQEYLKDLSSNWNRLQKSLQKDTSRPPKRKVSQDVLQPHRNGLKRRKELHAPRVQTSIKMKKSETLRTGTSGLKESAPSALALWAEENDISPKDLAAAYGTSPKSASLVNTQDIEEKINEGLSSVAEAGKYIALDCEMVGVGPDPDTDSALARISIVDYHGHQLYDSFVLPKEAVTDYRTFVSGITPQLLRSARSLEVVQADVAGLLDGRILVGHSIRNDLDALLLGHPKRDIRDTSRYPPYRKLAGGRSPGLKKLARELLGITIQGGEHSSVEDARTTMLLFRKEKEGFEREHARIWETGKKPSDQGGDPGLKNSSKKGRKQKKGKKKTGKKNIRK